MGYFLRRNEYLNRMVKKYYKTIPPFNDHLKCPKCKETTLVEKEEQAIVGRFVSYKCSTPKCKIECNLYINDISMDVTIVWYYMNGKRRVILDL